MRGKGQSIVVSRESSSLVVLRWGPSFLVRRTTNDQRPTTNDHKVSPMDIAVIGGGPAGAWAAYRLASRGARVTIFDPSHPREKPCGGGITGRALALVRDAMAPGTIPMRAVKSARFTMDGLPRDT